MQEIIFKDNSLGRFYSYSDSDKFSEIGLIHGTLESHDCTGKLIAIDYENFLYLIEYIDKNGETVRLPFSFDCTDTMICNYFEIY